MAEQTKLQVRKNFVAGVDVGGTKTHILDTISHNLHRFISSDFASLDDLLDAYFATSGCLPKHIVIAMAGPRNDETGEVRMTNCPWPAFKPLQTAKKYPAVTFATTNDMVAVTAGMVYSSSTDLKLLKPGKPQTTGTKVATTISTGLNSCCAVWDDFSQRRVYMPCESGHMGFQPYTESQRRHLEHLYSNYEHPSVELALAGAHGMEGWIKHTPEWKAAPELANAITRAQTDGRPVGAVLLELATEGKGKAKTAAHSLLDHMGSLVGNMLADYALVYKATGGIYLTGSISLGLGEYWAEQTSMNKLFVRKGTPEHAPWKEEFLENIPIYLSMDPHVAVSGALALAKEAAAVS